MPPLVWLWFVSLWVVGGIGSLYFWFGSNAETKRQLYPWFLGLMLVLMIDFVYFVVQLPLSFLLMFAVVGLVSVVTHARLTTFCPNCARMIPRGVLFGRVNFCPRCGQALDQPHTRSVTE